MTLEEDLLKQLDRTVKKLGTTPILAALIRDSVRQYLKMIHTQHLEAKHRNGYVKRPAVKGEFSVPESDRNWGE